MAGAIIYGRAELSALYLDEPFLLCGDGRWRIANPAKRLFADTPTLTAATGPVEAGEVARVVGAVRLRVPVSGLQGTGRFLPLTRLGDAQGWRLEAAFAGMARGLGGVRAGQQTGATVVLTGVDLAEAAAAGGGLYVVLDAGSGEVACVCGPRRGGDSREMRLSVPSAGFAFAAH